MTKSTFFEFFRAKPLRYLLLILLGLVGVRLSTARVQAHSSFTVVDATPLTTLSNAQIPCTFPAMSVATEQDLNDAVDCFNAGAADLTVTLTANINVAAALVVNNASAASLIIDGAGNIIDGGEATRLFRITDGTVAFDNLTASNGKVAGPKPTILDTPIPYSPGDECGGAIWVEADATVLIENTTFSTNHADDGGAICNNGTLTVRDTQLDDNKAERFGGAIFNDGELLVENSTLTNNEAYSDHSTSTYGSYYYGKGGGIYSTNLLTLDGSTISQNRAYMFGGGLMASTAQSVVTITNSVFDQNVINRYKGSAIENEGVLTLDSSSVHNNTVISAYNAHPEGASIASSGVATVTNSTLSANKGGIYAEGPLYVNNTTIAFNRISSTFYYHGPAIHSKSELTIENSLIASNLALPITQCIHLGSDPVVIQSTLIEDGSCGISAGTANNLVGDPLLAPLAANRAVVRNVANTLTHAIPSNSMAVDAGNNATCLPTDQKGTARPIGAACDLGAYEAQPDTGGVTCPVANANVSTEGELNTFIDCFNQGNSDATMTLTADIVLVAGGATTINNASQTLTIMGAGHTVNGNEQFRPFTVAAGVAHFQAISITKGLGQVVNTSTFGGAIMYETGASGSLVGVVVGENSAEAGGGLHNAGTLHIQDSLFYKNKGEFGGGIFNNGILTIEDSQIDDNKATLHGSNGQGAGIYNSDVITVTRTVLVRNFSFGEGGGILNGGDAWITDSTLHDNTSYLDRGGIYSVGRLWVANSTISDNGGTGLWSTGEAVVNNSTIVRNYHVNNPQANRAPTLGIYNRGTINVTNSIVADNENGSDCHTIPNIAVTVFRHSLVEGGDCGVQTNVDGNLTGDPNLGALQTSTNLYGVTFQSTPVHVLLAGSIAIDAGDDATCEATDQRGAVRPVGEHCDMGAYEGESLALPSCPVASANVSTERELNAFINCFNQGNSDDTMTLTADIVLADDSTLAIDNAAHTLTIVGNRRSVSGANQFRPFTVQAGVAHFQTISMTYGLGDADCGGARCGGGLFVASGASGSLVDSFLTRNSAESGGGLYTLGTMTLRNTTVQTNTASASGAGLFNNGQLMLEDSLLFHNEAVDGGAVYNASGLTLRNTTVVENSAENDGAGLYNRGTASINVGIFLTNIAQRNGGGVYNTNQITTFADSLLDRNESVRGAGMYSSGTVNASRSTIIRNKAENLGGGFYNSGSLTMDGSRIGENISDFNGGGIYNLDTMNLATITLYRNSAFSGGGVYSDGPVTIVNSTLSGNRATRTGGGFYNHNDVATFNNVTISHNEAADGGGIYTQAVVELKNSIVANSVQGSDCTALNPAQISHALVEDGSCNPAASSTGYITGDPNLGTLATTNGILMHVPQANGAVVGRGNSACETYDQRGILRSGFGLCDLGAYETNGADPVAAPSFKVFVPIVLH
ncbi:MAG: choice-of-anchor Q domain-containing protein [Candidatus Promineifilaceae bacterium]